MVYSLSLSYVISIHAVDVTISCVVRYVDELNGQIYSLLTKAPAMVCSTLRSRVGEVFDRARRARRLIQSTLFAQFFRQELYHVKLHVKLM